MPSPKPTKKTRDKSSQHSEFEAYVASLYGSLGFKITRNVNLGGQEVDVLAERFLPGIGKTRVAVECKWRSGKTVSNQEVYNFSSVTMSLQSANIINRGVMVTNSRYSPDALSYIQSQGGIELLTIEELEDQLLDVRQILNSYVAEYERRDIFSSYVPLRATWKEGDSLNPKSIKRTDNVENVIMTWLLEESPIKLLSVLGDYGAGKTTLLSRLKYNFSRRYLSGDTSVLPLLMPLKKFHGQDSLEGFIRQILISEFERDIPLAAFWRSLADGRLLILLDGFDEMAAEADAEKRAENFLLLSPLFQSGSKAVLSCRPSYFVTDSEYQDLVLALNRSLEPTPSSIEDRPELYGNVDRIGKAKRLKYRILAKISGYHPLSTLPGGLTRYINLELLNENQIDQFLSNFDAEYACKFGKDWKDVKSFLLNIYDLSDLMQRPILLTMINETILEGRIKIGSLITELGPSALYELYTSMKLDLDWNKGSSRRLIGRVHRAAFAEAIAWAMHLNGTTEVSYSFLLDLAERRPDLPATKGSLENMKESLIASDIQVSTFLMRVGDETFRFSHKSFMEFFVALHLKKLVLRGERHPAFEEYIPKEILYFLGGFSTSEPSLKKILLSWYSKRNKDSGVFARNVAISIIYSAQKHTRLRLEDTEISRTDLKKASFEFPSWRRVRFIHSEWRNISIADGELTDIVIEKSDMSLTVDRGSYDIQLLSSNLSSWFRDSSVRINAIRSKIYNSKFMGSTVHLYGNPAVNSSEYINTILDIKSASRPSLENCTFRQSGIAFPKNNCQLSNCIFEACGIFGLRIDVKTVEHAERYVEKNLPSCQGIVIVRLPQDAAPEEAERSAVIHRFGIILITERTWSNRPERKKYAKRFRSAFKTEWLGIFDNFFAESYN